MATKIRLKRIGRRNRPFYRLVVMDSRARRDGAAIEELGWYNPLEREDEGRFSLKKDRIIHWLQQGAQTSEATHTLLKHSGLAYRWHLMKQGMSENKVEKELKKWFLERAEVIKNRKEKAARKGAKPAETATVPLYDNQKEAEKTDASKEANRDKESTMKYAETEQGLEAEEHAESVEDTEEIPADEQVEMEGETAGDNNIEVVEETKDVSPAEPGETESAKEPVEEVEIDESEGISAEEEHSREGKKEETEAEADDPKARSSDEEKKEQNKEEKSDD